MRSPWDRPRDQSLCENLGPSYLTALLEGCPGGWAAGSKRNGSCGDLLALKMGAGQTGLGGQSVGYQLAHLSLELGNKTRTFFIERRRERERENSVLLL